MTLPRFIALSATALTLSAATAQAVPVVVTSEADFLNEIGSVVVTEELFLNDIAAARSITFDSGVTSTAVGGNPAFNGDNQVFDDTAFGDGDGEWFSAVGPTGVAPTTITWTFPTEITGFFASFESATFVRFDVVDAGGSVLDTVRIDNFLSPPNQFSAIDGLLGVVDTATPFNRLVFRAIPGVTFETFSINSFQFTDGTALPPTTTPIPLPAPALLLLSGLTSLMLLRRRGA